MTRSPTAPASTATPADTAPRSPASSPRAFPARRRRSAPPPGVTLYPIKVSEDGQTLYTSSLIYALHLAADAGVDVINMSLGGYSRSEAEADAVEYAHRRGCILVAAAGNEGGDRDLCGPLLLSGVV